ncbi:MAG: hypothetical protein HY842_19975 [Bacteroidetes bacterium]|nr:hypothetical protein [Bacteroidota bacterium]
MKTEDSEHRQAIFQNYLRFLDDLFDTLKGDFYQLLDGSFVTTKAKPGDIDLVTFLDLKLFRKNQRQVIWFLENSRQFHGLDVFFVPICRPIDPIYDKYLDALAYWTNLFGHTREDETGVRHPKGIIKINFSYEKFKSGTIL